jgi:hypothetical protein
MEHRGGGRPGRKGARGVEGLRAHDAPALALPATARPLPRARAALEGRYEKQLAEGLLDICSRLRAAEDPGASTARADSAARPVLGPGTHNRPPGPAGTAGPRGTAAAAAVGPGGLAAAGGGGGGAGDELALLSLLRRLQLWPVSVQLLRDTAAGRLVNRLRRHSNPQARRTAPVGMHEQHWARCGHLMSLSWCFTPAFASRCPFQPPLPPPRRARARR